MCATQCLEYLVYITLIVSSEEIFPPESWFFFHGFAVSYQCLENMVLYFCVSLWELSHLTHDLSQAEKEINVVTSWATDKMTTWTILSEIGMHLHCNNIYFPLSTVSDFYIFQLAQVTLKDQELQNWTGGTLNTRI